MSMKPLTVKHLYSYPSLPISNTGTIKLTIPDTPHNWYLEPSTGQFRQTSQMFISDSFSAKQLYFTLSVNNDAAEMNPNLSAAVFIHEKENYKGDSELGFIYYPSSDSLHFFQVVNANLPESTILKELLVSEVSGRDCRIRLKLSKNGNFYIKLTLISNKTGVKNVTLKQYISKRTWMPNMYKRRVMLTGTLKKLKDAPESSGCTLSISAMLGTKIL